VSPLPNTRPKNVLSFAYQCTLYAESESASNKIVLNIYLCIYKLYSKYFFCFWRILQIKMITFVNLFLCIQGDQIWRFSAFGWLLTICRFFPNWFSSKNFKVSL
jgi:hypothetical protein